MRKLEDIPKKSVFKVPDGYFDQLPTQIQARMAHQSHRSSTRLALGFSLKYALPVLALVVAGIFWFRPDRSSFQDQLEDIDSEQIALYLQTSDHLDLDDIQESTDLTTFELDLLEDEVYSNMEYPNDDLLEDLDLDNL